jgi:hypothetical protein
MSGVDPPPLNSPILFQPSTGFPAISDRSPTGGFLFVEEARRILLDDNLADSVNAMRKQCDESP